MTDEQKELFEKYTDCVRENQVITDCLISPNRFKLGARMMLEVMGEELNISQRPPVSNDRWAVFRRCLIRHSHKLPISNNTFFANQSYQKSSECGIYWHSNKEEQPFLGP